MNCERARQLWHDKYDGELAAGAETSLSEHLSGCEACWRWHVEMERITSGLDRLRMLSDLLQPSGDDQAPAAEPARSRPLPRWPMGARIAAAIALFIGGSLYLAVRSRTAPTPLGPIANTAQTEPDEAPAAGVSIKLTGESASKYLAVARPSSNPRVHVFWLYRIYSSEGR